MRHALIECIYGVILDVLGRVEVGLAYAKGDYVLMFAGKLKEPSYARLRDAVENIRYRQGITRDL